MGIFSKLFKGPQIDMEKSNANAKKMRELFNGAVDGGGDYRLIFGYKRMYPGSISALFTAPLNSSRIFFALALLFSMSICGPLNSLLKIPMCISF